VEDDSFCITTSYEKFESIKRALQERNIKYKDAFLTKLPKSTVKLDGKEASQTLKLLNLLEEHDDVQKVYSNFDIPDEILNREA
jgi:transcriptional/translational regulatory protein YebC/TACO1